MNYVTTNIRLAEEDYLRLKQEALLKRISLAEFFRVKLKPYQHKRSEAEIDAIMKDLDSLAKRNGKKLKGWNSLKALREMRYEGKW